MAGLAIAYTVITPQNDTAVVLLWLCLMVALRGLYKSIKVLLRVTAERTQTRTRHDPRLELIAGENVRRHVIQIGKLVAFIFLLALPLSGYANTTVSRSLLLLILFLVSGQAELDDDAITDFDEMRRLRQKDAAADLT